MNCNLVVFGGNLTADPEVRYSNKSTAICSFTIANTQVYYSGQEKREDVSFIRCTAFGKTGENISKYFAKGKAILVQGRLKQETWEDKKDGSKRSTVSIIVDRFDFVGSAQSKERTRGEEQQHHPDDAPQPDVAEDDVPF